MIGGCTFRVREDYRFGNLSFTSGGDLSCPIGLSVTDRFGKKLAALVCGSFQQVEFNALLLLPDSYKVPDLQAALTWTSNKKNGCVRTSWQANPAP